MTIGNSNYFCICVVVIISTWFLKCHTINGLSTERCSFPSFLQQACTELETTAICRHWSQGRRLVTKEGRNHLFMTGSDSTVGEYTWTFEEETITIYNSGFSSVFTCWQKIAPHKFIMSSLKAGSSVNVTFSCIVFRKRGRNVVEFQQSFWQHNLSDMLCDAAYLTTNENLLISNIVKELVDCPKELQGGLQITHIQDKESGQNCDNKHGVLGTFESDCHGKEGIFISFKEQQNCSFGKRSALQLALHCYSESWKDGHSTYFIAKMRTRTPNVFTDSDIICIEFQWVHDNEVQLHLHKQPICPRSMPAKANALTLRLRQMMLATRNLDQIMAKKITLSGCTFPIAFQGTWQEISLQNGYQTIVINDTTINIPPYGQFYCKQRYFFQHEAPYKCSSLVSGKWPGLGRVKFFVDDFLLVANFTNGCRPRFTRLGLTQLIKSKALVYRLSQGVPFVDDGRTPDEYYKLELLKQFCSSWLPYIRDPYPVWGRNIEKVILKPPLTNHYRHCSLPNSGKGIYKFRSVYANQKNCSGPLSLVHFACENRSRFDVKYDISCLMESKSFNCLGKADKMGEFSLVKDTKSMNISCIWFNKYSGQLFRLNSPQCSDIDWGISTGKEGYYFEKIVISQYYSKCPIDPETDQNYPYYDDYDIASRRNTSCRLCNKLSGISMLFCLLVAILN